MMSHALTHHINTQLPTLGATDFCAFTLQGGTFLAVSNEQDDTRGGDISSTIWALQPPDLDTEIELLLGPDDAAGNAASQP